MTQPTRYVGRGEERGEETTARPGGNDVRTWGWGGYKIVNLTLTGKGNRLEALQSVNEARVNRQ